MKRRHIVLLLLVALSIITYLDRNCIAVAGPRMQEELDISSKRWGWVLGAFILSYGLFEIPTGALGDRLGQRRVLTRIVVWWSAFTSITGMVSNYYVLVATRFLFGAGEAGAYPNMAGSIGRWFPAEERARAQGFIWAASRLGGALAPLLVVPLMRTAGWRGTFLVFGALGLVWAFAWRMWYYDQPCQHPNIGERELAEMEATPTSGLRSDARPSHAGVPWAALFSTPQLWLLMLMYWCYAWGSMFYLTWFPEFLMKGRGLTEDEMRVFAALPFLLGAAGNVAGGFLSDRLSKRFGLSVGRRTVGVASLALSACFLLGTAVTTGKIAAVILLSLGFGVMDCMLPAAWAVCLDIGKAHASVVSAAMNTAGQAGGLVCTVLFGHLVEAYGSYDLPLVVIACMVMTSAVLFYFIDPTRELIPAVSSAKPAGVPTCV